MPRKGRRPRMTRTYQHTREDAERIIAQAVVQYGPNVADRALMYQAEPHGPHWCVAFAFRTSRQTPGQYAQVWLVTDAPCGPAQKP